MYVTAERQLKECSRVLNEDYLQTLSVQSKFQGSADLETSCRTWTRLVNGFHPGHLSFLLCTASDTLPTAVNLLGWPIQFEAKCSLCDPKTAHVLNSCPVAFNKSQYAYHHDKVLFVLANKLTKLFAGIPFVQVFADLSNFHANHCPQSTIPSTLLITSYHPDIVFSRFVGIDLPFGL